MKAVITVEAEKGRSERNTENVEKERRESAY